MRSMRGHSGRGERSELSSQLFGRRSLLLLHWFRRGIGIRNHAGKQVVFLFVFAAVRGLAARAGAGVVVLLLLFLLFPKRFQRCLLLRGENGKELLVMLLVDFLQLRLHLLFI